MIAETFIIKTLELVIKTRRRTKARRGKGRQPPNITLKKRTYRPLDDLQKSILESEFLENPNPTANDLRRIAEQIGETRKRVKVKCFIIEKKYTNYCKTTVHSNYKTKHISYQVDVL